MALLIYKQWHRNSSRKGTPMSNSMNVKYIGERIHVLKDDENVNGLFGKLNGEFNENIDTANAMHYVYHQSCQNKTVYRAVISFTPERAEMLELGNDKSRWEAFVKYHIADIVKGNSLDLGKTEYLAAVHLKEGQPHVHIIFWDTSQKIAVNYVNPLACANIRENLELSVFKTLAAEKLCDDEESESTDKDFKLKKEYAEDNGNLSRKAIIKSAFAEEQKAYHELQNMNYKNVVELSGSAMKNIAARISGDEDIENKFDDLSYAVPKKGSLRYKELPPDVKQKVNEFVDLLSERCPLIKENIDNYVEMKTLEAEMFNSTISHAGRSKIALVAATEKNDIHKRVSNIVLQAIKQYNCEKYVQKALKKEEKAAKYQAERAEREKEAQKFQIETATISVLRLLKDFSTSSRASLSAAATKTFGRGDLSNAAIKDLLYKMQDKDELSR